MAVSKINHLEKWCEGERERQTETQGDVVLRAFITIKISRSNEDEQDDEDMLL